MAITWSLETTPAASGGWSAVIWVAPLGLYVAGGGSNPNKVMTSPDSINWTVQPIANIRNIVSLAWSGTAIVALSGSASNQCVFTSPDAVNWTLRAATPYGAAKAMRAVAYGAGIFVAVGGVNQAMYSVDNGVTWTASAALPDTTANLSCVTYDTTLSLFVAMATLGDVRIMTSPDGNTWTGHHGFEVAFQRNWTSITTDGAGNLAAVCTGQGSVSAAGFHQQVATNSGGIDGWTIVETPTITDAAQGWQGVYYSSTHTLFVAVGNKSTDTGAFRCMTATAAAGPWTAEATADETKAWKAVTYSSTLDQFVGVATTNSLASAMGGVASGGGNNVEIDGSGGVVLNRGTDDNGLIVATSIAGSGGLVLNRGTDDNGMAIATTIVGAGGLVLNRGTDDNGMTISTTTIGSGGLILNSGRSGGNGMTPVQCRDDWTNPGALPYVPLNVSGDVPPATECTDDWGPSAPGHLPYVPLQ